MAESSWSPKLGINLRGDEQRKSAPVFSLFMKRLLKRLPEELFIFLMRIKPNRIRSLSKCGFRKSDKQAATGVLLICDSVAFRALANAATVSSN